MEERDLDPDPLRQFERWFEAARGTDLPAPEAMALATATPDGRPSARMVLLKSADERGFAFHTNYESRKGDELAANPHAALLFHWQPLGRQVRVEGRVERVPSEESEAYFAPARSAAGWPPGRRPRAGPWPTGPSWSGATRRRRSGSAKTCPCRPTGAASASSLRRTSSGSTATTACTTASATSATATAGR